tara:strand:- start:110 stop:442 length:333 start_codon:yes stop_codon:yes gene_type:complete
MKVIFKSHRQVYEFERKEDIKLTWKLSLHYSKMLYNNLNKKDVLEMVNNVYSQYIQALKSNGVLHLKNKDNHLYVWYTLKNICAKSKHSDEIKKANIKQLYYTSLKKNMM